MHWLELRRQLERFTLLEKVEVEVRPRRANHVLAEALYTVADFFERKLAPLVDSGLLEVEVTEMEAGPTSRRGERER